MVKRQSFFMPASLVMAHYSTGRQVPKVNRMKFSVSSSLSNSIPGRQAAAAEIKPRQGSPRESIAQRAASGLEATRPFSITYNDRHMVRMA
jgi:hypothetical protein